MGGGTIRGIIQAEVHEVCAWALSFSCGLVSVYEDNYM